MRIENFGPRYVICNNVGKMIVTEAFLGFDANSSIMTKLLAIRLGLQVASQYNMGNLKVYNDAQGEVLKINCLKLWQMKMVL